MRFLLLLLLSFRCVCGALVRTTGLVQGAVMLVFVGCASASSVTAQNVKIADAQEVSGCKFVSDVHGSSGWGNLAASTGMQNAKNEALEQAASLGATHVLWTS